MILGQRIGGQNPGKVVRRIHRELAGYAAGSATHRARGAELGSLGRLRRVHDIEGALIVTILLQRANGRTVGFPWNAEQIEDIDPVKKEDSGGRVGSQRSLKIAVIRLEHCSVQPTKQGYRWRAHRSSARSSGDLSSRVDKGDVVRLGVNNCHHVLWI